MPDVKANPHCITPLIERCGYTTKADGPATVAAAAAAAAGKYTPGR